MRKAYQRMIESIEDGRRNQNGYWIHLKPGFWNPATETHSISETTQRDAEARLAEVESCNCKECQQLIQRSQT
jgi:hypothetical protein